MYEISDYMMDYINEKNLNKEYLEKIKIPHEILFKKPFKDTSGFQIIVNLEDYLNDLAEQMNGFLWEELHYKDEWKNITQIKLSSMIKKFDLCVCPFWLTFCEIVKTSFDESVYTLKF
jgi:hypothetical protein